MVGLKRTGWLVFIEPWAEEACRKALHTKFALNLGALCSGSCITACMTSDAKTVEEYLASLPEDRRAALSAIRDAINAKIPAGYEEGMQYGAIGWYVPHATFPPGYHCNPKEPLPFVGIASQKNHLGIYLFCLYMDEAHMAWFNEAYQATGKKMDMGKSCLRFKKLEDLALDVVAESLSRIPVEEFLANYASQDPRNRKKK